MPFNIDTKIESEILGSLGTAVTGEAVSEDTTVATIVTLPVSEDVFTPPALSVKMIMTANDGKRLAVVDTVAEKAVVLRRGDRLPDDSGFVSSISPNGISVIVNRHEVKYEVPEIKKYGKIRGSRK